MKIIFNILYTVCQHKCFQTLCWQTRLKFRSFPVYLPVLVLAKKTSACSQVFCSTINHHFTDSSLLRTVCLVPGERKPSHFLYLFNLLNMDTPLTHTLSLAPSVSILMRFDCNKTVLFVFSCFFVDLSTWTACCHH